jgi:DNA primase
MPNQTSNAMKPKSTSSLISQQQQQQQQHRPKQFQQQQQKQSFNPISKKPPSAVAPAPVIATPINVDYNDILSSLQMTVVNGRLVIQRDVQRERKQALHHKRQDHLPSSNTKGVTWEDEVGGESSYKDSTTILSPSTICNPTTTNPPLNPLKAAYQQRLEELKSRQQFQEQQQY